jgi:poly(A) polymerase
VLDEPDGARFVELALSNTDRRIAEDKPISPGFLFATLLWHQVRLGAARIESKGELPTPALYQAMDEVLDAQKEKLAIPRRFDAVMKEIWSMQPRFLQRAGQRPYRLLEHPRFRAAFDFYVLRAASGEVEEEIARWWEDFQTAEDSERESMLVVEDKPKRKRRRGPRRKKTASTDGAASSEKLPIEFTHSEGDHDE